MIVHANLLVQHETHIKNGIMINAIASVKSIVEKDYHWNPSVSICEEDKKLKIIADTSVIVCDATDSVSTDVTNTIPTNIRNNISTNVANTVSINFDNKKVIYKIDCYILHTFLLVIIIMIPIICYHYTQHRSKKGIGALTI